MAFSSESVGSNFGEALLSAGQLLLHKALYTVTGLELFQPEDDHEANDHYIFGINSGDDAASRWLHEQESTDDDGELPWSSSVSLIVVVVLVLLSGMFSGLTLGLLGLDITGLDILAHSEDKVAAENARKIIPVRKNGNRLLCTLLLGNVAVNSLLSILMARLTSGTTGFLVSTVIIVIFGEILPQASCSRYALPIGARTANMVHVLMCLLFPLAAPLAAALDWILGDEMGTIHSKQELRRLLHIHVREGALKKVEGDVVAGALKFRNKPLSKVMTVKEDCFMLSENEVLDYATILEISNSGFSRIPVYGSAENDIVGVLVTKDLIFVDPEDAMPLRQFLKVFGRHVERFFADDTCGDALHRFKLGRAHLGLVVQQAGHGHDLGSTSDAEHSARDQQLKNKIAEQAAAVKASAAGEAEKLELLGIVTLEDVIEEILQDEIVDETDVFIDMQTKEERELFESEEPVLPPERTDSRSTPNNAEERKRRRGSKDKGGGNGGRSGDSTPMSSDSNDRRGSSPRSGTPPQKISSAASAGSLVQEDGGKPIVSSLLTPVAAVFANALSSGGGTSDDSSSAGGRAARAQILDSVGVQLPAVAGVTVGSGPASSSCGRPPQLASPMPNGGVPVILANGVSFGDAAVAAEGGSQRRAQTGAVRVSPTPSLVRDPNAGNSYASASAATTGGVSMTQHTPAMSSSAGGLYPISHVDTAESLSEHAYGHEHSDELPVLGKQRRKNKRQRADITKLRFFNPQIRGNALLPQEVDVLVSHLLENYPGPDFHRMPSPGKTPGSAEDDPSTRGLLLPTIEAGGGTTPGSAQGVDALENPTPYQSYWVSQRWRTDDERDLGRSKWISRHALNWLLIERGNVETLYRKSAVRCPRPDEKDWIYKRGEPAEYMTIVLTGVLMIIVGRDGFQQECGAFSVFGIDALGEGSRRFVPDFSAALWSDVVTLVRISRTMYEEARVLEAEGRIPFVEPALNARIKRATKKAEDNRYKTQQLAILRKQLGRGPQTSSGSHDDEENFSPISKFPHRGDHEDSKRRDNRDKPRPRDRKESLFGSIFSAFEPRKKSKQPPGESAAPVPEKPSRMLSRDLHPTMSVDTVATTPVISKR
ncbi:unnamed protein product [Amoebophrya sp. A25]|nr:unnamed protein product [Amoebophrya sp. A25]|eukprot:GSA25T00002061001.1